MQQTQVLYTEELCECGHSLGTNLVGAWTHEGHNFKQRQRCQEKGCLCETPRPKIKKEDN